MTPVVVDAPRRRSASLRFDGRVALAALCTVLFGATAVSAAVHDRDRRASVAAPASSTMIAHVAPVADGGLTGAPASVVSPSSSAHVVPVTAPRPAVVDARRPRPVAASPRRPARHAPARAATAEPAPAPPSDFDLALGARR